MRNDPRTVAVNHALIRVQLACSLESRTAHKQACFSLSIALTANLRRKSILITCAPMIGCKVRGDRAKEKPQLSRGVVLSPRNRP
jgi:hypothetical protein